MSRSRLCDITADIEGRTDMSRTSLVDVRRLFPNIGNLNSLFLLSTAMSPPIPPSQPGGGVARCDKGYNPPYQTGLGQEGRVTLIRHYDDLERVAP
jgi:hypothetical protein